MDATEQAQETQEIAITIEQAEKEIKLAKAITSLRENKDFKFVIEEMYFEKTALGGVYSLGQTAHHEDGDKIKATIVSKLEGIAHLREFLDFALQQGNHAYQLMEQYEEEKAAGNSDNTAE